MFGPVPPAVWSYSVSGLRVLPAWLGGASDQRAALASPLNDVRPRTWTPDLTRELLELAWLLEATLDLEPALEPRSTRWRAAPHRRTTG